ncbi:tetratricopeptide repeat protein [Camelimonas abortus]|uniref:Tetratricopeptide repeat protein n=1 Tax=Camelimonas abortus TaxID=1017184 RepID=A0ABV7LDH1_9HYPH
MAARIARYAQEITQDTGRSAAAPAARAPDFRQEAEARPAPAAASAAAPEANTLEAQVEAAVARAVARALSSLPQPPAGAAGPMSLQLQEIAALPRTVSEAVQAGLDARLDQVDDHLADLTRTLSQHPAWRLEDGLGHVEARLGELGARLDDAIGRRPTEEHLRALLAEAVADVTRALAQHPAQRLEDGLGQVQARLGELGARLEDAIGRGLPEERLRALVAEAVAEAGAGQQAAGRGDDGLGWLEARLGELGARIDGAIGRDLPEERLRALLAEAVAEAGARLPAGLEEAVTTPVLRAIDAAAERIVTHVAPARERPVTADPGQLAAAVRAELAEASAGQDLSIARVESRLGALQESVAALTAQLRATREAAEKADAEAHAAAMAALRHAAPAAGAAPDGAVTEDAAPKLPRAAALNMAADEVITAGATPSAAEVRSRLIAAARRGGARRAAAARPQLPAQPGPRGRMKSWLSGKGLLWVTAAVVAAGSAPLLAPVLRSLPGMLFAQADMGVTPAYAAADRSQAQLPAGPQPPSIVNDLAALYAVADRIAEGVNVASPKLAASLLEKAATRGHAPAQQRLARLYEKGAGVPQDYRKALTLYEHAAKQGNVLAMHNLAVLHASGAAGRQDYVAAARWFRQAAEHGVGDSQYNLGVLLSRGLGEAADAAEALKWFEIAARRGDQEAARRRDEIAATLSPAALAEARAAAARWRPRPRVPAANDAPAMHARPERA